MKEARILSTTQIRLFPADAIPLTSLLIEKHRQLIRSLYNFEKVEPISRAGSTGISYLAGSFGSKPLLVEEVTIEERRIVTKVQGTTDEGAAVYERVKTALEEINGNQSINELLCTHETATSVILSVPFELMFSQPFLAFLDKSAKKYTKLPWSDHFITPLTLSFRVQYKLTDDNLLKNHITLASKILTIEPRHQSNPEDRHYWISSPTDTDTHFKLIDDFEKSLEGGTKSNS